MIYATLSIQTSLPWGGVGGGFLLNDCAHVALAHHEELLALELQLSTAVFSIEHLIAFLEEHLFVLGALTHSLDNAMQGFLLCSIRNNDSTDFLFSRCRNYQHAVS